MNVQVASAADSPGVSDDCRDLEMNVASRRSLPPAMTSDPVDASNSRLRASQGEYEMPR